MKAQKEQQKIKIKNLIKQTALEKKKLSEEINEISITVATVGDSRTGKSEMSEKNGGSFEYERS